MDLFKRSCEFFDVHYRELVSTYPDEFIGIFDGQVRAHAADLSEMLAQLDALGVPRGTTHIEFVAANPRVAIL